MSDAPSAQFPAAWRAGASLRCRARRCRAAHGERARHAARPAAPAALEKTHKRLVYTAFGFGVLFLAVVGKLADATILQPLTPHRPERPIAQLLDAPKQD